MLIRSYFSGVEDFDLVFDLKEKNKIKIWHLVGVSEIAVAAAAVAVNTHQKISHGFACHIRNVVDEFLDDRGRACFFPGGRLVLLLVVRATNWAMAAFCFRLVILSAKADGSLAENGDGMWATIPVGTATPKLDS